MAAALKQSRIVADKLGSREARNLLEGGVDVDDVGVAVGDQDRFPGLFDRGR